MTKANTKTGMPVQVILMLVIVLGVIVSGFLVFPRSPEERDQLLANLGTTNQGVLLAHPVPVDTLNFLDEAGNPWHIEQQPRKWRLLVPGHGDCGERCQEILYITRQAHIRLGKNSHRLQRLFLNLDDSLSPETAEKFGAEHPYLAIVQVDAKKLADWLELAGIPWAGADDGAWDRDDEQSTMRALLVDQNGNGVLYYQARHDGNQMLEDLNHLLRYSPE